MGGGGKLTLMPRKRPQPTGNFYGVPYQLES